MLRPDGAIRHLRRALLSALSLGLVSAVACSDDNGLTSPASIENATRVYSVYALSGTSSALPAAYQFASERLARPQLLSSGGLNFDLAFDIAADGRVLLLPAATVVPAPPAGAPVIGLQRVSQTFLTLLRAPDRDYGFDSTVTVGVGETVAVEVRSSPCVYGEPYYAKVTIDSIIVAERRIVVRSLTNRNCGYRSLTEGLPAN